MQAVRSAKLGFSAFLLDYILRSPRGRVNRILTVLARLGGGTDPERENLRQLQKVLRSRHPFPDFLGRLNASLSPSCRKKLVENLIVRGLFGNRDVRRAFERRRGFTPPLCVSIAPTSRCNLRCDHCSASGQAGEDLDTETIARVLSEARDEMGVHFFILTGGEPFVHPGLLTVIERFRDCYFQIFTNGTLLDDNRVGRLAAAGNALVMLSLEGYEDETDRRRSGGTFVSIGRAMQRLRDAGVPFGYSIMTTSRNCETVTGGEFVDWAIGHGCLVGYYFNYMPVGIEPDLSLMPSPEQRDRSRRNVYRWRNEKPIFLVDVVNDGPLTGGCTSSGRYYVHVLSSGDVTPCVYSSFSTHNVKDVTLTEALEGPYLSTIRRSIPFEGNALRCCLLLDRPGFFFRMLELFHPRSCVRGEQEKLKALKPHLEEYARRMREIYDRAWEDGDWESVIRPVRWRIGN